MLINNKLFVVKNSSIHGRGLFAREKIPKGTVIWKFNPKIDKTFRKVTPTVLKKHYLFYNFAWFCKQKKFWVYETDRAKWINHSSKPNCSSEKNWKITKTTKAIKAGEEITEDYGKTYSEKI